MVFRRLVSLGVVIGAMSLVIAACGGGEKPSPTAIPDSPSPPPARPVPTPETSTGAGNGDTGNGATMEGRQITIVNMDPGGGGEYEFQPAEVEVAVGETVTFELIAKTELHSFTVDALDIDQDIDGAAERDAVALVTYTFESAGMYDIVCIYHEGSGMTGTLTVR